MRSACSSLVLALGLLMAFPAGSRAEDQDEARAVIDKAIKAVGGEDKVLKYRAASWKGRGMFYGTGGPPLAYTGEWAFFPPERCSFFVEGVLNNQRVRMTTAINGDKCWVRTTDKMLELTPQQVEELKEQMHVGWITTLVPLKEKEYTLTLSGEIKVGDRPARGVKVVSKGHRDVYLYFDTKTDLLVKTETKVRDEWTGREIFQETVYGDYQLMEGIKRPHRLQIKRDGKPFVEGEMYGYRRLENPNEVTGGAGKSQAPGK